ncbi:MAG: CPCC family cysteine-rich protein [Thiomicrospira sp.]|jgi:hypothetical protein|nr:CPCC family cysteine-rich protein [Thiomicrospira sp.]
MLHSSKMNEQTDNKIKPREQGKNGRFVCPCCGYATLDQPGEYEICDICFWEDNGIDDPFLEEVFAPNSTSLNQARQNFLAFGACDRAIIKCVREPTDTDEQVRLFL